MASDSPASQRLPGSRRIKRGGEFARAKADGRRIVQGCLIMNWIAAPTPQQSRLGVITSRKVGCAVIRSRSRRLLREAFRRHQGVLNQPLDVVLVARASIAGKGQQAVDRDYLTALQRGGLLRPSDNASGSVSKTGSAPSTNPPRQPDTSASSGATGPSA